MWQPKGHLFRPLVATSATHMPLFFGRLIGLPEEMNEEVVTLSFIAKPLNYQAAKAAVADTMRQSQYFDPLFIEFGALRILECWGEDVPRGKQTDFFGAVKCQDDETVVFSWIEWPDKATRDAGMKKMMEDPRMDPKENPMPFDGKRMIFGGFQPVLDLG